MSRRKNLLLCFDAFGTLIKPNQPVLKQYATVAEQCGLGVLSISQLQASFKAAYKAESKANPNFGKATGLGAEKWWGSIITKTFSPFIDDDKKKALPFLTKKLLYRFSSSEGYDLAVSDLGSRLKRIKERGEQQGRQTIVGVITNSDDRIPGILTSLGGMDISGFRYGQEGSRDVRKYDIDFHCMSYDVGFTKPSNVIFDAGMAMGLELVDKGREGEEWTKVYVGDEVRNDVLGASDAGWHSVLVLNEKENGVGLDGVGDRIPEGLLDLGDQEVFLVNGIVRRMKASSLKQVLEWFEK
ncbi:hypothetical protein QBC38DRAFT_529711 [Podospora fimiseda]|uniref:Hydrolase n=1 Tax=Podospora fimiseda TaxID=252190 RepID=A0AAN7GWZ6_9PEZI|nr:hypothetical protein QBC38DRAFT_529711 [Podospora fimiseda]